MRKTVRILTFALLALHCACAAPVRTGRPGETMPGDPLRAFFTLCEQDMARAVAVIERRALVDNLTHLLKMNEGGDRFYLLEREAITEMIRSVTEGIYSDFILINAHGTVIYTMRNDDLFAKSVRGLKPETPLARCFSHRKAPLHVEDVSEFPRSSGFYRLLAAGEVRQEGAVKGVFIMQVDMEKLLQASGQGTIIASADGLIRADARRELILSPLVTGEKTSPADLCARGSMVLDGRARPCRAFSYASLQWMVIGAP